MKLPPTLAHPIPPTEFKSVKDRVSVCVAAGEFLARPTWAPRTLDEIVCDGLLGRHADGRPARPWLALGCYDGAGRLLSYLDYKVCPGTTQNTIQIGVCFTEADCRGRGLMQGLLRAFLRLCRENYPHHAVIVNTHEHNEPMKACFRALGFREYDRKVHDRVDGTDTLWYRRDPGDPLPPASP